MHSKFVYRVDWLLCSDLQVLGGHVESKSCVIVMTHLFLFGKFDGLSVISRHVVCFCIKNDDKIT